MELSCFTENIRKIFDLRKHPRTTSDESARSSEVIALGMVMMSAGSMAEYTAFLRTSSRPMRTLRKLMVYTIYNAMPFCLKGIIVKRVGTSRALCWPVR
jgi:hypothetical protein